MAASARIALLAALPLLLATAASADETKPLPSGARCEGTLCDWYYSGRPADAPAQTGQASTAAAAPSGGLTSWFSRSSGPKNAQPAEEPSSTNGYMSMGGGGLIGGRQERCGGTLCDAYYGATSKEGTDVATASGGQQQAAAEPPVVHRHIVHESETRPKCFAPAGDPWRCLR